MPWNVPCTNMSLSHCISNLAQPAAIQKQNANLRRKKVHNDGILAGLDLLLELLRTLDLEHAEPRLTGAEVALLLLESSG